jgi:hypothetical protein
LLVLIYFSNNPMIFQCSSTLTRHINQAKRTRAHLIMTEPPRPRIEAIRIVDMSSSNSWAEFAGLFRNTREAFLDHERAKTELKAIMPEDAKEAIGHGVRGKRSRSGAVSFDVLSTEAAHAPVQ